MATFSSIQACPRCGRVAPFSHPDTTVVVCVCGAVLNRKEGGLLLEKSYTKIVEPNDSIQVGTTGVWQQKAFTVLGRFRVWLKEAVVNYWTIAFDDGSLQYLVESYGLYAIYQKLPPEKYLLQLEVNHLQINKTQRLQNDNADYLLEKKDTCYRWEIEGELLLPECDAKFTILDFSSEKGHHIEVVAFLKNYLTSYEISYTTFEELALDKLQRSQPIAKQIRCGKCLDVIVIAAYPYSQSLACHKCYTRYVLDDEGEYNRKQTRNEIDATPNLQLGASGLLKGIQYTVIGATVKREMSAEQSQWREYTLYNPQRGYAFLSEYDGHWIYMRQQGNTPVLMRETNDTFTYENEPFKLFNYYSFRVLFAAGEFPNNLFNDSEKLVREYISPPEVWIRERSASEGIEWYLGQHISGKELETAFGDKINLPYKNGVGAVQPAGYINPYKIFIVTVLAALLLIVAHLATIIPQRQQVLFDQSFVFPDTAASFSTVAGTFTLNKQNSNIEAHLNAALNNSWAEVEISLVNVATAEEFSLNEGIEYYYGYTDGESWSEGDNNAEAYFSSVPTGAYKVLVSGSRDYTAGMYSTNLHSMQVRLTYDVPNHRNLAICLGLLVLWSVIQSLFIYYNEKRRWSNSPVSPYETQSV